MEQNPPLPRLTGEPIPEPEEIAPSPEAAHWRRLQYFLFHAPHGIRTDREIIRWWEDRRFAYNAIVGSFGMVSYVPGALVSRGLPGIVYYGLVPVFVGVIANLCYCIGWIAEIILQRYFVRYRRYRVGQVLMKLGLGFSVFIVLAPVIVMAFLWMIGLLP